MIQGKEANGQEETQQDNGSIQQLPLIRPLLGAFQCISKKELNKEYQGNCSDNDNERGKVREYAFHGDLQQGMLFNDTAQKRENISL